MEGGGTLTVEPYGDVVASINKTLMKQDAHSMTPMTYLILLFTTPHRLLLSRVFYSIHCQCAIGIWLHLEQDQSKSMSEVQPYTDW